MTDTLEQFLTEVEMMAAAHARNGELRTSQTLLLARDRIEADRARIEELEAAMERIRSQAHNLPRSGTAETIVQITERFGRPA